MPNAQLMVTHDIRRLYQSGVIQSKLNTALVCSTKLKSRQKSQVSVQPDFLLQARPHKTGFFHVLYDSSHQNVPHVYSTAVISKTIEHC